MSFEPYVPERTSLKEFTARALLLGIVQAVVLGAANAYLGMKAGTTIAATFPAAVVSMLVLRALRDGSILEENISRTAGSVGEALVAGAVFTLPAFVISGLWTGFNYWESTLLMLVGGLLGIFFVIFLRRTLCNDASLPFPEAVAAAEIHKAGQKGATGAGYLFAASGMAGAIELFKNPGGFAAIHESVSTFIRFATSKIAFTRGGQPFGEPATFGGGIYLKSPTASPAYLGVGYIIGPRLAALNFSGGVIAWVILVPMVMFLSGEGSAIMSLASDPSLAEAAEIERLKIVADQVWRSVVRPIAVGGMLVAAIWTLLKMRTSLTEGLLAALKDVGRARAASGGTSRLELDIRMKWIVIGTILLILPMTALFAWFTKSLFAAFVAAVAMTLAGFVFSAVGGYLVGVIGSSSSPISGLALSSLIFVAVLLVAVGTTGGGSILAVLAVATVVCCAASLSGEMIQDLKVGQLLGGTPWAMEVAEIVAVIVSSFVLVIPIALLHQADVQLGGTGIGGESLPAPQAGLMAMLAQGIVGGGMAWPLVIMGMGLAFGLILMGCRSPMIVAVGMYLSLSTTAAIFLGGALRWVVDRVMARRGMDQRETDFRGNVGTLLASGMIAGEALVSILLAILVNLNLRLPTFGGSGWGGLIVFGAVGAVLVGVPLRARRPAAAP